MNPKLLKVLKPLSNQERAQALDAVRAHPVGRALDPQHLTTYPPELRIEKPAKAGGMPGRFVFVRLRDRRRHVFHSFLVRAGRIHAHVSGSDGHPPFSDAERETALGLLEIHDKYRRLVKQKGIGVEWFGAYQPSHGRRVGVRLLRTKRQRVVAVAAQVVVDLDNGILIHGA